MFLRMIRDLFRLLFLFFAATTECGYACGTGISFCLILHSRQVNGHLVVVWRCPLRPMREEKNIQKLASRKMASISEVNATAIHQPAVKPPSIGRTIPLIIDDASLSKNMIGVTISSGSANRPKGILLSIP